MIRGTTNQDGRELLCTETTFNRTILSKNYNKLFWLEG